MLKQNIKPVFAWIFGAALLLFVVWVARLTTMPSVAQQAQGLPVFQPATGAADIPLSSAPTALRQRYALVDRDLLRQVSGFPGSFSNAGEVITLNLFDDVTLRAVFDRVEYRSPDSFSWVGHVEGKELSIATLVVEGEVVVGNIAMMDAFYQIRYGGNGHSIIIQADQSAYPPEMEPVPVESAVEASLEPGSPADDGSQIDVLVVYTQDAEDKVGGAAAMTALINLAISESNTGYQNSNVTQRLRLVHAVKTTYNELGGAALGTDLSRLANPADGYVDEVHSLRNTYKADMVDLLVGQAPGAPYCGIAYLMTVVSPGFEDSAFSVVEVDCATGYYSFAHELGHNMGLRHDWYVDNDTTPYTYAHGFVNVPDQWRTIMAYNNECSASGSNCTRLPYWSNPAVNAPGGYGGDPMGIAAGTNSSCVMGVHPNCDADDHMALNNTAYTVANFRVSGGVVSTPTPTPTATPAPGKLVMPLSVKRVASMPTPTFTPTPPPSSSSMLPNGDFEQGQTTWTEFSTHGWDIIMNSGFPGSVTPHGGSWAAWLGGDYDDISYIEQSVQVPAARPYLVYWHWIASEDACGFDVAEVLVNGTQVDTYDLCDSSSTGGWVTHAVNLNSYANQTVTIRIQATTDSSLNSNLFVDDVYFYSTPPLSAPAVNPVTDAAIRQPKPGAESR